MKDRTSRADDELLRAVADGDTGALRVLYDRRSPWLTVRLVRRCNDRGLVAEVLQDTFVAVWQRQFGAPGPGAAHRDAAFAHACDSSYYQTMTLEAEIADRALRADELIRSGRAQLHEAVAEGRRHGLSQRRIAGLIGRSQPEVGRILQEIDSARRSWLTARDAAEAIKTELQRRDEDFALRLLIQSINGFRDLSAPDDIEEFLRRPRPTGDRRWDTLLAASVARACRKRGLASPAWTRRQPLESWWFPLDGGGLLAARTMQRTPIDFSRLGIWLDASAFQTA